MKRTLAVTLSTLTLAACHVKLPGGTMLGGGSSSSSSGSTASSGSDASSAGGTSSAPPPANPEAPPPKPVGDLAPYYASLTLAELHHRIADLRQDEIYEKAKADVGRDLLWQAANPDPTWIREWRQRDWVDASENAEAMTQAAFNRAWEQSCVAEFAASRKAHADAAAALAPELARVDGLTNYYDRMAGYAALAAKFEDTMTAAGLPLDKDPFGPVGFRVTVLAHAVAFHNGSRHAWTAFPTRAFPLVEQRRDGLRELTDDTAQERAAYCGRVASSGGVRTTSFTSIWSEGHMSARRVAWPTVTGDEAAVRSWSKDQQARAAAALEIKEPLRVENLEKSYGFGPPAEEPKLAGFREFKVTAVKGDTVTATRTDADRFPYGCRTTHRIDRITDDGHVIYQQDCKYGDRTWDVTVTVRFDELPAGVALATGDVISFAADVDGDVKKQGKKSASKDQTLRTVTATGRHLFAVQRGGTRVW